MGCRENFVSANLTRRRALLISAVVFVFPLFFFINQFDKILAFQRKAQQKNREKQLLWQKEYYEDHKEHVLKMHKIWAQKNMDTGGSVWRKYGRRRRNKNPNLDKEYRLRRKYKECINLYPSHSQLKLLK